MAAASAASISFLPESLTKANYERWSVLMRNYLMGHDLWDVVFSPCFDDNWPKKNAMALFVIQHSCGPQAFRRVQDFRTAKDAWNRLRRLFSPYVVDDQDVEPGISDTKEEGENFDGIFEDIFSVNSNIKQLYKHLKNGKWDAAKSCIANDPTVVSTVDSSGRSILDIAGHEEIGKKLIDLVEEKENLLKIKEKYGFTAVALAVILSDNPLMAKYRVQNIRDLQRMESNKDEIPVHLISPDTSNLTSVYESEAMMIHLYTHTPWGAFSEEQIDRYMRELFIGCIDKEIFDVALTVLRRFPRLPLTFEFKDLQPLYDLAQKPAVFRSGYQLKNWWQIIFYKILNVERDYRKKFVADNQKEGQNTTTDIEAQADPNEGQDERTDTDIDISHADKDNGRGQNTNIDRILDQNAIFTFGKLLLPVWVFVQNLILLKFSGIKELYETKVNHDLLDEILEEMTKRISKSNNSELQNASAYNAILAAATHGVTEFVRSIRKANPRLLESICKTKGDIVTNAIRDRRIDLLEEIYKLPNRDMVISKLKDEFDNNVLHFAAESAAESGLSCRLNRSSCPGQEMEREIKLFKKVERMVPPEFKEEKNAYDKTPREVFCESHEEMAKASEKWTKDSASSFSVVATLIITITFTAVFTVPGGYNQETGIPILLNRRWFKVFMIADAMSLFLSITSVLIFVRVLSSNHRETDFLESLSSLLQVGKNFLCLSVVSMMVTFYAALTLMLKGEWDILITVAAFAFITLYVSFKMSFPLFFDFGYPSI